MADNYKQDLADTVCLLSLPPELLVQEIFSHLPLVPLIRCLSLCKQINELISSSIELAYQIELEVAGMKDNPHCSYTTYPVIQRLEMLREREQRWSNFDWKWRREVEFPPLATNLNHDLAPGLYLRGKGANDDLGMTGVYVGILPSDKESAFIWIEANLGKKVIDFTESVENDLLACVSVVETSYSSSYTSIEVDFLTLSTGLPHPQAASPTLEVRAHHDPSNEPGLCVETCGENFALTYGPSDWAQGFRATLCVWDWRTGKRKCKFRIRGHTGLAGLVFLREDFLMQTNTQGNCLDVFHINPSNYPGTSERNIQIILSLSMPELTPGYHARLQSINHPSPSCSTKIPHVAYPSSRPFFNDAQAEIILITSHVGHPVRHNYFKFAFLTHRRFLLDLALNSSVPRLSYKAGDDGLEYIFSFLSWEEWGPLSTRIFPLSPYIPWQGISHATAGQRWASISPQIDGTDNMLELVDFNQLRIRRTCQSWPSSTKTVKITLDEVANTGVIVTSDLAPAMVITSNLGVFVQDIHSSLPCIRIRYSRNEIHNIPPQTIPKRDIPGPDDGHELSETPTRDYVAITGVRMEEERIIGLHPAIGEMKPMMDILYFG